MRATGGTIHTVPPLTGVVNKTVGCAEAGEMVGSGRKKGGNKQDKLKVHTRDNW